MINVLEVNNKVREVLGSIKLIGLVDYGDRNIINEPRTFKPIQVAFQNIAVDNLNSNAAEYSYYVVFLDKVRNNTGDLEQVQSKIVSLIIEFISKINRTDGYTITTDSSQYVIAGNDKLHGYELSFTVSVFNPEQIC